MLSLREVRHGSELYRATVALRNEVLRRPLGLELDPRELELEAGSFHLAALEAGAVLGCVLLTPLREHVIKLRQLAVRPERQRQGLGRALVERAERFARERGFRSVELHAREPAVPFYERRGYARRGEPFLEVGIAHLAMDKAL